MAGTGHSAPAEVSWVGFSGLETPRDRALGGMSSPWYQRQGSHCKFLAVQPHIPHVPHCDPVHLVELWCYETDISKNRKRASEYDARTMSYGSQAAYWCIKLFRSRSASCGMCFRNISACELGVRHDHVNQPVTHDSEHNMTGSIHHHTDCDQ